MSSETRVKVRAAALLRGPMSAEVRAKVSANSSSARTVYVYNIKHELLKSCRTLEATASYCGCHERTIRIRNKSLLCKQFYVRRNKPINI